MWALGQGVTEVHCRLGLDFPGLIHTWLPTCDCIWTCGQSWYVQLNWSYSNLNGASRVGFGGIWIGSTACAEVVCTKIGLRQSEFWQTTGVRQLSVGLLMDGNWFSFNAPCKFLVWLIEPFWGWLRRPGANMKCLKCGCLWLGLDAGCPYYSF